jgi:hypothetical protein
MFYASQYCASGCITKRPVRVVGICQLCPAVQLSPAVRASMIPRTQGKTNNSETSDAAWQLQRLSRMEPALLWREVNPLGCRMVSHSVQVVESLGSMKNWVERSWLAPSNSSVTVSVNSPTPSLLGDSVLPGNVSVIWGSISATLRRSLPRSNPARRRNMPLRKLQTCLSCGGCSTLCQGIYFGVYGTLS